MAKARFQDGLTRRMGTSVRTLQPFCLSTLSLRSQRGYPQREHLVICNKPSVPVLTVQSMQRCISYFAPST